MKAGCSDEAGRQLERSTVAVDGCASASFDAAVSSSTPFVMTVSSWSRAADASDAPLR